MPPEQLVIDCPVGNHCHGCDPTQGKAPRSVQIRKTLEYWLKLYHGTDKKSRETPHSGSCALRRIFCPIMRYCLNFDGSVDTIRMRLLKIAARAIHSAGYVTFKLCSSCPYKAEFHETLRRIQQPTPMPN